MNIKKNKTGFDDCDSTQVFLNSYWKTFWTRGDKMNSPHPTKYQPPVIYGLLGAVMIVMAAVVVPLAGVFGIVGWIAEKLTIKRR